MKDYFSDLPEAYNNARSDRETPPAPQEPAPVPVTPEAAVVIGIADITKESIRCFTEYAKCKEHEITERKRIHATLRAVQYQIDAQKEMYRKALELDFEERNRLYDMAEKAQEKALEIGDKEMLKDCYNFILAVFHNPHSQGATMPPLLDGASLFL